MADQINVKYFTGIGLLLLSGGIGFHFTKLSLQQGSDGGRALAGRARLKAQSVKNKNTNGYEAVFDGRRQRVEKACNELFPHERLPDDKETLLSQNEPFNRNLSEKLIVNEDLKLIWCRVPKVAGSYWKVAFAEMHREMLLAKRPSLARATFLDDWPELRSYPPEKALQMLEEYTKVMWVRSPHVRLISAYRNKIMAPRRYNHRFNGTRAEIREQFGPYATREDGPVSIEDFFQYLKTSADVNGREKFNVHWRPYFAVCDVCKLPWLKFDYIGKLENINAEGHYIKHQLAPNLTHSPVPRLQPRTSSGVVQWSFSQVAPSLARQVLDLYREDYQLFQYDHYVL